MSCDEKSIDERAKELGLTVYDTALPQDWVDDVFHKTGTYPVGHFVWCYDRLKAFGEPVALTTEGEHILKVIGYSKIID